MKRVLLVCAALLVLSFAQRPAGAAEPTETVIRLTVRPAAASKPALKYQLLPELREMEPGNPIQAYFKCFAEQHNFWKNKEVVEKRAKWQKMPLQELPLEEMRKYGLVQGYPLRYADYAARLDTPDWQILLQLKRDSLLLLPELQQLRELADALKVRFRYEVVQSRFDDALATAKTMLAFSRHLGEHPTLIGELVALGAGSLAFGPLDEMISQPGCPNLFWALANLPRPFIDLHKGVQADRIMMSNLFTLLPEDAPMSETQGQQTVDRIRRVVKGFGVREDVEDWLKKASQDEDYVRSARKRLTDMGLAEDKVKQFPAPQVILLEEKLEYSVRRDEIRKAMTLPYWQAAPLMSVPLTRKERPDAPLRWLRGIDYHMVRQSQARLDQRIALLCCVEALRMYAAEHDGKLPAKLEDISLPLPVDPVTGKSFVYNVDGKTAHLQGGPLDIQARYEVTIGK